MQTALEPDTTVPAEAATSPGATVATAQSEPGEVGLEDYRALAEFRYQIRRFLHFSESAARAAGLEPQHHQVLLAVRGLPEGQTATIGTLAERLQLQHHSVAELVARLEEKGLVERHRRETDRRQVLVDLTTQGERLLHDLSRHHMAELRSAGRALVQALGRAVRETPENDEERGV